MMRQAVPLQPMEVNGGADIHLQPMEDFTLEQVEAPEGGCDPVGSPHWSRLLAGRVAPWREEPTLEQVCGRTCDPVGDPTLEQSAPEGLRFVEGTHAGAVHEELQPMGRTHVGEVCGGLSAMGGTPCWSRGRM
ncbi:hypothetical protein GRJ2_000808000 [Grus japonensis]|uniref:Uncharacterized protein n=1 Tax=Grus japonensis TaxID=30415 RepID=A0ABC9WGK3_GRUJA